MVSSLQKDLKNVALKQLLPPQRAVVVAAADRTAFNQRELHVHSLTQHDTVVVVRVVVKVIVETTGDCDVDNEGRKDGDNEADKAGINNGDSDGGLYCQTDCWGGW